MSDPGAGNGWVQVRVPPERADQAKRVVRTVLREPFQGRSWAELGYFLASAALTYVAMVAVGALGAAGIVLSVVFVGVLLLACGLRAARGLGYWQRTLARRLLGEEIPDPEPFRPRPGFFGWLRSAFGDRAAWRSVAYVVAKVPLTVFGVWFALSVWLEALFGIVSPFTGGRGLGRFGFLGWLAGAGAGNGPETGFGTHVAVFLAGVLLLFVAPWTMRLVVYLDRQLMHLLLGPDAATSRVRTLEASRAKTLDAATETLQRIERNLHDGTQAQLVALAMRLGQAKDKLDHLDDGEDPADLDAIRKLVDDAHRGAKEAITDLRDLARGIHPPALDTGLENALATLAARSPVPTEVTVSVESRPGPAIEAICYFCAAELLANVAQHAQASRASLTCTQHGPWLRIVVRDDGRGGASVNRVGSSSSGLAGLADRVGAVDGHLTIASPSGGPTVVTVDLPTHA
ncbi:MAG TPA: sensor domain-containing protein [Acidimicrobiales bacterium]|nr:sensor domain-containing protein [Acidimicrobiales bacterium]